MTKYEEGRKVAIALMKSDEANATLDVLEADYPDIDVTDQGPYWMVAGKDEIRVDMERVSQELGRPLTLSMWLVIMSTYVGRAQPGADYFLVTTDMLDMADIGTKPV